MRSFFAVIALLAVAACGGSAVVTTEPTAPPGASTTEAVVTTAAAPAAPASSTPAATSPAASTPTTAPPEFALFLTAVGSALDETNYADDVLTEADVFVAMGQLMCERLTEGASADDVLESFVGALETDGVTGEEPVAIGVVFGAAIELLCPQHAELLG